VTALECDLEGVLADERDILNAQLVGREARHAGKTSGRARFASAFGARARPTQALARVSAPVAALPNDLHHLAVAVYVDRQRKRVGVFQLPI
jgi:hypothetical protein